MNEHKTQNTHNEPTPDRPIFPTGVNARLEHANITVADPDRTAQRLVRLLGWRIRWRGGAIHDGYTVHVGDDDSYIAIYSGQDPQTASGSSYRRIGALNHLGVVVDDLDAVERRVREAGYEPHSFGDYEPGRRFYFTDDDGVEYEIVSYTA